MRLELTRRGDDAVRAMLALADAEAGDPRLSAAIIGERMHLPASYSAKVMADLSRAGMTRAAIGRGGGLWLARSPRAITLLDIVREAEGTRGLRTCVLRGSRCGEEATCRVHDAFVAGHDALLGALADITLDDVAGSLPERPADAAASS